MLLMDGRVRNGDQQCNAGGPLWYIGTCGYMHLDHSRELIARRGRDTIRSIFGHFRRPAGRLGWAKAYSTHQSGPSGVLDDP